MSLLAPLDNKIIKANPELFTNLWENQDFKVGSLEVDVLNAGAINVAGNLSVDGSLNVLNGINFGQGNLLDYYRLSDVNATFINCTNTGPVVLKVTRVGRVVNLTLKAFNYGTSNGGTLQTLTSGGVVPSWARPATTVGVSSYAVVASIPLFSILWIVGSDGQFTIHKASSNIYGPPANGDTVNISNDLTITFIV